MDQKKTGYRLIDVFCGAGGMSLGFSSRFGHEFEHVWANDSNASAVETFNRNFGGVCTLGDIGLSLESDEIPSADIVIGGPPCQGFSLLNKNRSTDPRKALWKPFVDVVDRSGAEVFVMENVPQLLGSSEHGEISEEMENRGFRLTYAKLCAADYGVPQVRWRAFIVGSKFASPDRFFPPRKTHYKPVDGFTANFVEYVENARPWRTVRDVIGDLPPPVGTAIRSEAPPKDLHFGRRPTRKSLRRYEAVPREGMNRFDLQERAPELTPPCWIRKKSGGTDLFGRLWWDRPALTIRTEFFKPEKGRYLHPEQHRPLTHREAARLQSFPDDFRFAGSKIEIARQIGNAVPPLLAARIAGCIVRLLRARKEAASTDLDCIPSRESSMCPY